jgi:hypothetical protein
MTTDKEASAMKYQIWGPGLQEDGVCTILEVSGVEDSFELDEGVSRAHDWPDDAYCSMDPDYPKDVALEDSLYGAGALVVSGRVKQALEGAGVNNVEFLPLRIVNHKGRIASKDYFIVNPLDVCDCIDIARSVVKWNAIDPDSICGCKALVLKEDAVPTNYQIFRPEHWRKVVLIRRELADTLRSTGLSGLDFIEPHEYTGLF